MSSEATCHRSLCSHFDVCESMEMFFFEGWGEFFSQKDLKNVQTGLKAELKNEEKFKEQIISLFFPLYFTA